MAFHRGYDALPEIAKRERDGRWTRGIVLVGPLDDAAGVLDSPVATVAGPVPAFGTLAAIRDRRHAGSCWSPMRDVARAGRLLADRCLPRRAALRRPRSATTAPIALPTDRDDLRSARRRAGAGRSVRPRRTRRGHRHPHGCPAERGRRGFCSTSWWRPTAPAKRPSSAPSSTSACSAARSRRPAKPTHLDLPLPDGLVGTNANVRAVVQRRSAQGDCRFEPQGYPAQILGSSALVLARADAMSQDFSDLAARWADGLEVLLPASAADAARRVLGLVADVLNALSPEMRRSPSDFVAAMSDARAERSLPRRQRCAARRSQSARALRSRPRGRRPTAPAARCSISAASPAGAVAQIVEPATIPACGSSRWRPTARCRRRPTLQLDHGDVAFLDHNGVALAMSTERDTLVQIYLSGPGVVADDRRALPLLDHRRPVAARDRGLPVRAAADVPPAAGRRGRIGHAALAVRSRARRSSGRPRASSRCRSSTRRSTLAETVERAARRRVARRAIGSIRGSITRPTRSTSNCRSSI